MAIKKVTPTTKVKKSVKRCDRKRDYAIKNKIGNRGNGRPVSSVPMVELTQIMSNLLSEKKGRKLYSRDRTKIERELKRRQNI